MQYRWEVENSPFTPEVKQFATQLNVPPVLARILQARGITDFESARRFFRPNVNTLNDPYSMKSMEAAVERILQARNHGEKILIFGDYDVDGTTATSLLYLFLKQLGLDVYFYIPDRLREGYGLSMSGVRQAHRGGVTLIVAVDCGVTAVEQVAYARQLGIDVIVCDHHEPGDILPDVVALLNPKQEGCDYPFKELSGVGVAFKLIQALALHLNLDPETYLQHLDLVALGTAADIVPLVGENRVFAKIGFERLSEANRAGVAALLEVTGLRGKELGTGQVVFILAPRINAVGRMGDAERAVRLLIAESKQNALNIAAILESENRQRRHIDEETFREAVEMVESEFDPENDLAFVLAREGWHAGVIGIVASRVAEKYYRPTVMIALDGGLGKGSARSIRGFDIYQALRQCQDFMTGFGGHKYAAGLTIEAEQVSGLRQRLQEVAASWMDEEMLTRKLHIDGEIRLTDITPRFIKFLDLMGPYGPQNMRPVFMSRDLQVVGTPTIVGENHLRLKVRQDGRVIDAIGFNLGDLHARVALPNKRVEMAYLVDENEWQGQRSVQLRVKDVR
jgi:single-stranded-DNA-specific exonuclease